MRNEDLVEIRNLLHHISVTTELDQSPAASLEGFCIENLMPWVAKYDSENYANLACDIKLNALNQKWAQFKFLSIRRGEKLPAIQVPRIAPWGKPTSDYDRL